MSSRRWFPGVLAGAIMAVLAAGPAMAQQAVEPVAVVEGQDVTDADVAAILTTRRSAFPDDPAAARQRALETLVAEIAIATKLRAAGGTAIPDISTAIEDASRQILFEFYAQSQFQAVRPTEDDVDAYIAANPRFFEDRVEYRFVRIMVRPRSAADAPVVRQALARLEGEAEVTEAALDAALGALARGDVPFTRQLFWDGGEVLDEATLDRLEAMQSSDTPLSVVETGEAWDVIRLFGVRPAPIDPANLRLQIADRILLDRFQARRAEVIGAVAAPYLASAGGGAEAFDGLGVIELVQSDAEAGVPRPDPQAAPRVDGASVYGIGSGLLGALAGFGLVAGYQWVRSSRRFTQEARSLGRKTSELRVFDRSGVALPLAVAAAAALIGTLGAAAALQLPSAPVRPLAVFGLGGAILGLVTALLFIQSRNIYDVRPVMFARALFWSAAAQISVAMVVVQSS